MSDCNSMHSIWKPGCNMFMSTENGVANIGNDWWFSQNLFLQKQSWIFFLVKSTVAGERMEMHKIVCHNLRLQYFQIHL